MTIGCNATEVIDLSTVRVEDGAIRFDFTCPRCGHQQTGSLQSNEEILYGKSLYCANVDVCGVEKMHLFVNGLELGSCSYKDSLDVPLKEK